jgi:hypothetical protein
LFQILLETLATLKYSNHLINFLTMKNLQALANALTTSKMTLLLPNDMLNIKGGCGCVHGGSNKIKSAKRTKSIKNSRCSGRKSSYTLAYVG